MTDTQKEIKEQNADPLGSSAATGYVQLSGRKKRGCPTCDGIDAKSCMRCNGRTKMCDWYNTEIGWSHMPHLSRT